MDINVVKEELRQHILQQFLPGEKASNLADDTPLRTSGVLDSIAVLQVVRFIEERYAIELEAHEMGVENFDSLETIAALIARKKNPASEK